MNYPRNTNYERLRAPRTMNEAFGAYAQLHIPPKRYNLRGALWAVGYGIGIGVLLYVVVLVRVGS
jgi:hypothetical protein